LLKQTINFLLFAFVVLVTTSCAKPKAQKDCGYVQNVYGERVSWKQNTPVSIYMHSSVPTDYEAAIRQAAETWNKARGKTLFIINSKRVSESVARDGLNVIYYQSTWEQEKAAEQARTSMYWMGDQVYEADIRINAQYYKFYTNNTSPTTTSAVNMESLILHELGHVLGLRHNDAAPSVMATYLKPVEDRSQLQESDKSSLACEYL
jgi:predicted Zn-dependent protease